MKYVKDLYNENYKTLLKKIEEGTKKWNDIPCSWTGRTNIVKMTLLPKALHRFNAIPIKIPSALFKEVEQKTSDLYRSTKNPELPKPKNKSGGITLLDFKL